MDGKKVAGHRVWDPPDPIPNSEVKPRSVPGASVVFGHVNPRKLAITSYFLNMKQADCPFCITGFLTCSKTISWKYSKFITDLLLCEEE